MNDHLYEDSPIPEINDREIAELVNSTENATAFERALRRVLRDKAGNLAAHGSSPVIDE